MELKDIKIIIDLMKKNDLSVFLLEREGFKLKISRGHEAAAPGNYVIAAPAPGIALAPSAAAPVPSAPPTAIPPPVPEKSNLIDVTSPMVGTYYQAMSPEAPPYVKVGQTIIKDETVVCIIEAMKVMNEIKADASGVVTEVLVENGKSVQFGQPLFRVRPA